MAAVWLSGKGADGSSALARRLGELTAQGLGPLLLLYQGTIGPLLGGTCKFYPSCSNYAREAVARYGWRGVPLTARRLWRCRPFVQGGWDPVPDLDED